MYVCMYICVYTYVYMYVCMRAHTHTHIYIKDCSKKTISIWYNVTSCPSLTKMLPLPPLSEGEVFCFSNGVTDGVTHPYSLYQEPQLTHSTFFR